jgi:hypothetical protein
LVEKLKKAILFSDRLVKPYFNAVPIGKFVGIIAGVVNLVVCELSVQAPYLIKSKPVTFILQIIELISDKLMLRNSGINQYRLLSKSHFARKKYTRKKKQDLQIRDTHGQHYKTDLIGL